jgi:nitrite reductase (NADH) large subunit
MVVCTCAGVTRGALSNAVTQGCATLEALAATTRASTVCGSCRPLLVELLGGTMPKEPATAFRTLIVTALLVLVVLTGIVGPWVIPYGATTHLTWAWNQLWRDGFLKQASGFTLVGLSALLALLSVRKRVLRGTTGRYGRWRAGHVVVGGIAVLTLVAHTGLRMGSNMDRWLMAAFVGTFASGALASLVMGLEHRLSADAARRMRTDAVWLHLVWLWPVPVLLAFHVLKTYYF